MKRENNRKAGAMIIIGASLILIVSLMEGFEKSAANTFYHIINDLTAELLVHAYIAGIVLAIFGLYIYASDRNEKKNIRQR
jgi:hypothetical protein